MGRVSRIIRAASSAPRQQTVPTGLEPVPLSEKPALPAADVDLPRVIACWEFMPDHFKQTIMTLVQMTEAKLSEGKKPAPEVVDRFGLGSE